VVSRLSADETGRLIDQLWRGMTAQEIAQVESLPYDTVKSRIQRIYMDYGVKNRASLIATVADKQRERAIRADLISPALSERLRMWTGNPNVSDAVADALRLAFDVRTNPPTELHERVQRWLRQPGTRVEAMLVALAALVPLDRSPDLLLRWLTDRQPVAYVTRNDGQPVNGQTR
jgi:hypothetical protein